MVAFKKLDVDGVLRRPKVGVCYLCGEGLTSPRSADHIPPKDFFAESILEELKPNLWTLPTHTQCNNSYKDDEEYFVATLRFHVAETWAGGALTIDFLKNVSGHEGTKRLFGRAFREMKWEHETTASGRRGAVVAMNHEDARIRRVSWKIVRGLYFLEQGTFLPEASAITFEGLSHVTQLDRALPGWWQGAAGRYPYPRVFDYRFKGATQSDTGEEQWTLRLWENLIWQASFPSPSPVARTAQETVQVR